MASIKTCKILNYDPSASTLPEDNLVRNQIDETFIVSDGDEELLILLEFNKITKLQNITFYSLPIDDATLSPPKQIDIYITRNLNIDFESTSSLKPSDTIICSMSRLHKGDTKKFGVKAKNAVKFKKVKYLVIYVKSNQNDTEQTYLNGIQFNTNTKRTKSTTTEDKVIPMLNNDVLADALRTIAVGQYFDTLPSDEKRMNMLKQIGNDIISMEPTRLDWHRANISEEDLLQCCPDYCKIKPTRQDIASRDIRNELTGMALLHYMQQGNVTPGTLNVDCSGLSTCPGLTNICAVLERYQRFMSAQTDLTFADYFGDNYNGVHTLNYFHHLLFDHHAQFEDICDTLMKRNGDCSLQKCEITRRHYRDRSNDIYIDCDQVTESIEQSLLDKIHCHYLHSFDIGYKFRKHVQDRLWKESRHVEENKDNDTVATRAYNNVDVAIHKSITSYRRSYEHVEGLDRILNGNNRFHTEIDEKTDVMIYDHGKRFFYWDHYEHLDQVNDPVVLQYDFIGGAGFQRGRGDEIEANIGYKVKDWYIREKYGNLKAELLKNPICRISIDTWNHDHAKGVQHSQTNHAKTMKSRGVQTYGIIASQPLSLFHIIAMLSYCNHDDLQAKFSETFRQKSNESDDDFKERHRHFAHFARLLREVVECYGQQHIDGPTCHNQILFHGISQQAQFQTINPCFKGPVSATMAYAVALSFSQTGCVIQFRLNKTWLYQRGLMRSNQSTAAFLDVEWLSDYPNEQERFFIGGYARFSIESIIMWPNINYDQYITAMRAIWQKIGYLHLQPPILSNYTTKLAYMLLSHEFHRYWPNNKHYHSFDSVDEYVEKLFHNFCINLRVVWFFAMKRGCGTYEKMDNILDNMFLYDNGIPKLKETMTLFPSATEIRIRTNCNGTSEDNIQMISNHKFWKLLLVDLKQTGSLTELIVEFSSNAKCVEVIQTMGKQYATQLNSIGWKVALGTSPRYGNPDHTLIIEADKQSRKVVTD